MCFFVCFFLFLGIPVERQVISQWWQESFYRIYVDDKQTLAELRLCKNEVLRMDEISDAKLNLAESLNNWAFQVVQFIGWDKNAFGRKEMQTSFPTLFTISEDSSLFDLRYRIKLVCFVES